MNPLHYAREFPWAALGLALGAGLAFALTGADAKAASAAVDAAKSAGSAAGDAAVSAKDAVVEKFSGDDSPAPAPVAPEQSEESGEPSIRAQAADAICGLLNHGLAEILASSRMVAEGVQTTYAAVDLARRESVEMPITEQMYLVLREGKSPREAVRDLMERSLKPE